MAFQSKNKYNAIKVEHDNIKFASKAEGKRYLELKLLRREGWIRYFLMQVPFNLPGNVKYKCDFFIVWKDGSITVEDVKGVKTPVYILKKKQVEEIYNIKIEEV